MLKNLIKQLTEEQVSRKNANTKEKWNTHQKRYGTFLETGKRTIYINGEFHKEEENHDFYAIRTREQNKAMITVALNLYHKWRGSDYRHGFSCHTEMYRVKYENELRERFCLTEARNEV